MSTPPSKAVALLAAPLFTVPLLVSCGPGAGEVIATATLSVDELPGQTLQVADRIGEIDLAVDGRGTLHVVWNAELQGVPGTLPSHRVVYARGDGEGPSWSAPAVLGEQPGPVRVIAAGGRLDLVTGLRLAHFRSTDGGRIWNDLGELLPADVPKADRFDLAAVPGALLIAVLVRPQPPWELDRRGPEHRQRLLLLRLETSGEAGWRELAAFPASLFDNASPRLVAEGRRLDLAVGLNQEERRDGAVVERGRLFHLSSADAGASWEGPLEVPFAEGSAGEGRVEEVELARAGGGLLFFATGSALRVSRQTAAGGWSEPRALSPYRTSISRGELRATSVSSHAAAGRVAWVDHRYRRSDRRLWNPLGGLPWSDHDPLWANSDLFALTLAEVETVLAGGRPEPLRLTPPLALAGAVRVGPVAGGAVVVWSGRRRVGREPASAGAPPRIFSTALPAAPIATRNRYQPRPGRGEAVHAVHRTRQGDTPE